MRQKSFIVCLFIKIPLNTVERTMKIGDETVHVTEIDWEKSNWKRILTPDEEREIAARLNGGPDYDPAVERLLAASSSTKKKPTFKVKRLGSGKLQGASFSSILKEREKSINSLFYRLTVITIGW
jgi:hypothetical protein